MKSLFRCSSAILSLLMLASCSAGESIDSITSGKTDTSATVDSSVIQEIEHDNGRVSVRDTLPETMDFENAVVRVFARAGDLDTKQEFIAESTVGEVVNDAVYARNLAVQERLNVQIEVLPQNVTRHAGCSADIRKSITAGSDDFEIAADMMYQMVSLTTEGAFLDLNSLEYLDFEQPWWNQSVLDTTEHNGRNFMAMGELSQTMISGAFCMFFNKTMFHEFYSDEPSLYATVLDGTWTLDKLISYCTPLYADLNGNGQADENDRYGHYYVNDRTLCADALAGGCQLNMLEKNGDGTYTYNGVSDRMASFTEKMYELIFENNNSFRYPTTSGITPIVNGNVMFYASLLSQINDMRDMGDDFGIIPIPKLDETQQTYSAYSHDGSTAFGIPVTENEPNMVAAFLEAMSAETYRVVTPAYFETALKTKYSRDDESSMMLDMIVENFYLDISYIYGQMLPEPINTIRIIFKNSTGAEKAMSTLAAKEKAMLKMMERIIEKYEKIE